MKYKLLLLLVFLASSLQMVAYPSASANDRNDELYIKYEPLITKIKDETNCSVIPRQGDDDYFYFELLRTTDKGQLLRGVYNMEGKMIIPVNYNRIEYCPSLDEGVGDDYFATWHAKTDRSFLASVNKKNGINIYTIFGVDGVVKRDNIEATNVPYFPVCHSGYLKFERRENSKVLYGLYTSDGRQIAPIEYDQLYTKGKICHISKKINMGFDEYLCGAFVLDKSLNLPDVPCKFSVVEYDKDKNLLMVRNRGDGESKIPYRVNMYEASTYSEDLYYAFVQNSCISYCVKQFIDGKENIHDLYYIAECLNQKTHLRYFGARVFVDIIKKGELNDLYRQAYYKAYDFEVIKDVFNIEYKMYSEYIQRVDKYQQQNNLSEEEVARITFYKLLAQGKMNQILEDLKSLDGFKEEFQPIWEKFAAENNKRKLKMVNWNEKDYPSFSQALFAALVTGVLKPDESVVDLCNSANINK